ncbi:Aste57867_14279 [Aphanomyces stellatus]|uniref:Aste57867_14279 protein n=1 Tax=Aphanomyces stellatus TaxID=120398 RepID=A0A485L0U3_9STRA|nr:hypothetical protein As57867_014227 [Aphanomyces stellatus]VFT91104.1 Aste57867_14279 [Aphanomyces stellatus]
MTAAATTITSFQPHHDAEELNMRLINADDMDVMKNVKVSLQALGMDDVQLCDKSQYAPKTKDIGCACCQKKLLFYGKHHCRVCGDVVCGQCSTHRIKSKTQMKSIRTCNKCFSYNLQLFNRRLQGKAESSPSTPTTVPPQPLRQRSQTESLAAPIAASPAALPLERATSQPPAPITVAAVVVEDDSKTTQSFLIYGLGYGVMACGLVFMDVSMDTALFLCAAVLVIFLCLLRLLS